MSYFPEIAKDGLRFVISQISDSRKELEIRLVSNNINQNEEFIFVLQNDEITRTDFYTSLRGILDVNINSNVSDVVIPVNNGEYIPLVNFNYYLDPVLPFSDVKKHQFVIKTNKPLPPSFKKLSEIKLLLLKSEIVSNEIMYGGALEEKPQQFGYPLDIDFSQKPFENNIKETSGYESLAEITSSVPEYRLESISSGSSVHKKRLVDYSRFENFIFFSSAEKRLVNFKDKLIKIENQLSNISQSLYAKNQNESNFNNPVRTIRNESFTEINKIVNTFTDYENWLYYDMQRTTSGSAPGLGENYTNSAEALNISSNISQQFNKEGLDIVYVLSGSSEEKINILNEKYKLDDIKFNNTTGSLYLSFLLRASSSVSTNLNHKNTLTSSTPFYPMDALNLQNIAKPSSTGSQYRRYIFAASGSHWRPKQNITIGLNQVNFGKDSSDIILTSGSSINSGTITAVSDYAQYTTYNTSSGVTISGSFVPRGDLFNLSIDATGDTNLNGIITDVKVTTQNPIDVQPFHHLYSTNSGTFTNWYNGIISEASFYDSQNIQRLINNLPSAFLDDAITNAELLQWVDTIGEFFDEYKTLIDDYYKLFNKGYSGYEQVPTKYNKLLAENLGLNILPIEENNFLKFFGIGDSFTDVPEYSDKVINNVLNNLSYLYKTKGTRNSILALLNCYGLPSNVLKIKEGNTHLTEYDQSFLSNDTDKSSVNIFDLSGSISFESKTNNFISLIVGDEFDNTNFKVPWNPSNEITQSSIEGVFKMPNTANTMSLFSSYANNDSSLLWQVNMVPSGSNTTRGKFQFRISSETHGSSDLVGNSVITETDYLNTLDNSLINILVQKSSSGHEISDIHTYELSVGKLTPNDGTILFLTSSKVAVDGDSDSTTNKNFISGSQGKHLFISNNFTGSVAQIKSYSTPLSMTAFKQHIYNKKSVVGTHFTSSLTNLQFHYPLNENLKSGSNKFTIKDISTLSKGGDIDLDSNLFESKSNHYDTIIITDYSFPIFGDGSGQSQHSDNLITIDDEQKLISNLSPNRSVLRYNSNDYRGDYNEIQTDSNHSRNLYFSRSPQEIINDFLKDNLGNLDFNDLFADPRDDFKTTYPDLDNFNKDLQSYDISVDLTRFINPTTGVSDTNYFNTKNQQIGASFLQIKVGTSTRVSWCNTGNKFANCINSGTTFII